MVLAIYCGTRSSHVYPAQSTTQSALTGLLRAILHILLTINSKITQLEIKGVQSEDYRKEI